MTDSPDRIARLLRDHPLVDGHNDLPWAARTLVGYDFDRLDLAAGTRGRTHTDLPRLRAGGVGAQFWSVFVPASLTGDDAVSATLEQVDAVHQMIARHPEHLGLARTADELERVFASGRIASLLGAEGGHSINCSLATLRMLHVLGVRYLTLTHNDNVPWADSATDEPVHHGLTRFGVEVVREMNRVGMMVDLSHVSPDTMRDAIDAGEAPVIFSHSGARAVTDHPRNVPDDVLRRLPETGGLVMLTFVPKFVRAEVGTWSHELTQQARAAGIDPDDPHDRDALADLTARREESHPRPRATIGDVVAHVEHAREVAGVDHLGLGGDYDGVDRLPEGLEDVSGYPALLAALADRGWSDDELIALAGGNLVRVMREVEQVASRLQQERGPSVVTRAQLDG